MITISSAQEFALLSLAGEIDLADAADLEEAIGNLDSEPVIIVSLEKLQFLDSTILGIFVRANAAHDGNLIVVLPDGAYTERIFVITGLREKFRFAPSLLDAVLVARTLRDLAAASYGRDGVLHPPG
ncbi:MAG: hypothetical protein NVSMB19_16400 [Vulcanimicrobiaceae bacterium]